MYASMMCMRVRVEWGAGGVKNEMPPLTRAYRGSTQNRNREAYRLLLEACCVTSLS